MTGAIEHAQGAGCDVCREGWYRGERPQLISPLGGPALLYRCVVCGTFWLMTDRLAEIVSHDEARRLFPDSVSM